MSSNPEQLKVILLPLSIRKTLFRHRLILEDILSLEKIKDVLPLSAVVDLGLAQNSIYQMVPFNCPTARLLGTTPVDPLPVGYHVSPEAPSCAKDDVNCGGDMAMPIYGSVFQLYSLFSHYAETRLAAAREFFQQKVTPASNRIQSDQESMKMFYRRIFRKGSDESYGSVTCASFGDSLPESQAFEINFVRENFAIITYDEMKFPDEENFRRLVASLLEAKHRYSNFEIMAKEMGDLLSFHLRCLHQKPI